MTFEDRLWDQLAEDARCLSVPPRWSYPVPYRQGDVVVLQTAVKQTWLQRLLRRPVRYVTTRWRAQ